jgi:CheY-like chemotaxis protein
MDDLPRRTSEPQDAPPTVLVVDDEAAIREVVAALLEDEGYAVRQAADGHEALAEVAKGGVDVVLSDVAMPRLDGLSLARQLRSRGRAVPVVLMSAAAPKHPLPAVPFLPKPFAADQLTHVIAGALGRDGRAAAWGQAPEPAPWAAFRS